MGGGGFEPCARRARCAALVSLAVRSLRSRTRRLPSLRYRVAFVACLTRGHTQPTMTVSIGEAVEAYLQERRSELSDSLTAGQRGDYVISLKHCNGIPASPLLLIRNFRAF